MNLLRFRLALLSILLSACFCFAAEQQSHTPEQQSPTPELPADVPKDATVRIFLSDKTPSGQDAVWTTPDGVIHEFFQFNDRGRGPKTYSDYKVDSKGLLTFQQTKGVDYLKSPVNESFSLASDQGTWKNESENEKVANAEGKFFVSLDAGPQAVILLAQALLKNGGKLQLLPGGEASIRKLQSVPLEAAGNQSQAVLYEITGLSFTPNYVWFDENNQFLASVKPWNSLVRQGYETSAAALLQSQRQVAEARAADLAAKLTHTPSGDLLFKNVAVFDSVNEKVLPSQRVTIRGERIVSVDPEQNQPTPTGAEVIDGGGKMLLPGLWDMHSHLFADSAFLDMATGVTSIRDLGNSIEELGKLRKQIEEGRQIGPRIVMAGFIDGPGPYEGPVKVLAATPEEARQRVDHYADLGYVQIKIYSSVKPELVPVIIEEAHKRGLRVSGHVPAGMTAEQFVRDGADEIQHMNFIFLNFMPDVKETRTPARFTEPGKRGASLDLNSEQVNQFIALLKQHHAVVDPTMGAWEGMFLNRPGQIAPGDAAMFQRLPLQAQRGAKSGGGLPIPDAATDETYRKSYANFERMLRKLYDSGVQIVAGTDAGSGYAFDRELEIYVASGLPTTDVLSMATFQAAKLMKRDNELGSIASGKLADVILVNGDPTKQISDIRKVDLVVKSGAMYKPSELYPAMGIRAQ
jgi:imidazolonepropionase-like amidohydrolase